jgi:molecular chaperone GrpE
MKKNQATDLEEEFQEHVEPENTVSVDDFLRQLEAKEKDLHITANLAIEIEESDVESAQNVVELESAPALEIERSGRPDPNDQRTKSELAALKNQVSELKSERIKLVERNKQTMREFDNFKNRMERERRETFVGQLSHLASSMLPVLDNLGRALDFASSLQEEKSGEFKLFFEGIELVNQQIMEILDDMGVQPIASVGEQFDPQFHEAVAVEPAEGLAPNAISAELLRGYKLGDKIIRHSMVKVATDAAHVGEPETAESLPAETSENESQIEHSEPPAAVDDDVEELIASSYAQTTDPETN